MSEIASRAAECNQPIQSVPAPSFRDAHNIQVIQRESWQMILMRATCNQCGTIVEVQQHAARRGDGIWEITKVMQ